LPVFERHRRNYTASCRRLGLSADVPGLTQGSTRARRHIIALVGQRSVVSQPLAAVRAEVSCGRALITHQRVALID
jgi:hypothetical protein